MASKYFPGYTLAIPAGSVVDVNIPVDLELGIGHFAYSGTEILLNGIVRKDIVKGFVSEDPKVGSIKALTTGHGVEYTQLTNESNRLHFFAASGKTQVLSVLNVPIHDHGSIVGGGPAFGSYYSEP